MTAGWCATDPEAAVRGGSSATTAYCGLVVAAASSETQQFLLIRLAWQLRRLLVGHATSTAR